MSQRKPGGIPRPTGIPRPGSQNNPNLSARPTSGFQRQFPQPGTRAPPYQSNLPSGIRPPQQIRPGPSGLRPPSQSMLRPPYAGQRSLSVPPRPTPSTSRSNITAASRSGGQIPTRPYIPPPAASSTLRPDMEQSFAPKFTSSRMGVNPPSSTPFGIRPNVPANISNVSRLARPDMNATNISNISRISRPGMNVSRPTMAPSVSRTSRTSLRPTSKVESQIRTSLMNQSSLRPGQKVTAKAKVVSRRPAESTVTAAGREPVLQKAVLKKQVERDQVGEIVTKNIALSNLNEDMGYMDQVEMGIQQFDPQYPKMDGREVIGVTSGLSVTPEYTVLDKDYMRAVTDEPNVGISAEEVAYLVEEEKQDVNNTLRMIPPDLLLEPGKYEMKHRLQQMRLNTESVALLEKSIIRPEVTADEAQEQLSPEAMSTVMYTVETGIKPESSPDEVFNSLFREPPNENFINLTSVTPGPLQDVVVPTDISKDIHKEVVSVEMTKLADRMVNTSPENIPTTDIFSRVMEDTKKNPEKGKNKHRSFPLIQDERSLWVNANLEPLVNIVGAEPVDVLDPFNLDELEKSGKLESELMNGVEYFVETNPVQYINRVQLRGSQMPSYFPGYIVASPDLPDLVKVVKNPDDVFTIAWKSVQPKYFEEESMMSILV